MKIIDFLKMQLGTTEWLNTNNNVYKSTTYVKKKKASTTCVPRLNPIEPFNFKYIAY